MAQVCGDSSFDYAWDRQHEVALGVLRKAADLWASNGVDAVSADALMAVLLRIYLSPWSQFGDNTRERRDLDTWLQSVTSARDELATLHPGADPSVLSRLDAELSFAIKQWVLGDPELPPTAHTINVVEHALFSSKLTRRPASPKLPTSLLSHESSSSVG